MPRSVNSVQSRKRRKQIMKLAKGYFGRRSNVWTIAKNAVEKALCYSYRDRKVRKRDFARLWVQRISAASRENGLNYSTFMHKLSVASSTLNRKVLADIAMNSPETFKAIVSKIS